MQVESVTFNGIVFRRYPNSRRLEDRRYFKPNGKFILDGVESLHRELWKAHNGPIPDGFDVHHLDENADNNAPSNLGILSRSEHHSLHGRKKTPARIAAWRRAQSAAALWHGSAAGLEWHAENARKCFALREYREYACDHCGKPYRTRDVGGHRFCSNACKSAARRKSGVDSISRDCAVCGKPFTVGKYLPIRTCGRPCGAVLRAGSRAAH